MALCNTHIANVAVDLVGFATKLLLQTAFIVHTTWQVLRLSCALAGDLQYLLSRPEYCRVLDSFSFTSSRKCLCSRDFDINHGNTVAPATANDAPTTTSAAAGGRSGAWCGQRSSGGFVGGDYGAGGCRPDHTYGFRVRPTLYQVSEWLSVDSATCCFPTSLQLGTFPALNQVNPFRRHARLTSR